MSAAQPRDFQLSDLFADRAVANGFRDDLLSLIDTSSGSLASLADDRYETWVTAVAGEFGPALTALVFPPALRPAGVSTDAVERPVVPAAEHQHWRTRARRLCNAVVAAEARPPIELRMAVARLYLDLLAAGVWQAEQGWRGELAGLVELLPPTDDEYEALPGRAVDYANSLAAVCMALLLQDASLTGAGDHDRVAREAWQATHTWTAFADVSLVADYLYPLVADHARVAGEAEISGLIEFAADAEDDPDALLRMAFEKEDIPAVRLDGAWVVDGEFRNPRRFAARTATIAGSPCVVVARNTSRRTIVVFDGNTVAIAESAVRRWRIYQLGPASTPLTVLGSDDGLPATRDQFPLLPVPDQIQEMATHAGVNTILFAAALR